MCEPGALRSYYRRHWCTYPQEGQEGGAEGVLIHAEGDDVSQDHKVDEVPEPWVPDEAVEEQADRGGRGLTGIVRVSVGVRVGKG